MCGICGFTGKLPNSKEVLEKMMLKIYHRGPDQSGTHLTDQVALGFRRLSIIDLDHGMQPMYNEDKKKVIVFNGEIYNFKEIRADLEAKGHVFANNADTECIVHGYEEYGTKIVDKLRGMFAFSIWDEEKQSLFAARDFFGIKPYYYAVIGGHLVFASEIKSILEFPGYERQVNIDALEQYLSFQYDPLEETFFKGIYKLKPGHMLEFNNNQVKISCFWKPSFLKESSLPEDELKAHLEETLNESIQSHLISDVEVGSLLSSGVDSSYLTAVSKLPKTYTVGFAEGNGRYNEVTYAKRLADKLAIKNTSKIITKEEYFDSLSDVMYYMDEPLADPAAVALYFVDQLAAKDIKVVLSGEGSDELFGGYNIYCEPQDLRKYQKLPRVLRKGVAAIAKKLPAGVKGRSFLIRGSKTVEERFIGNANMFSYEDRQKMLAKKGSNKTPQQVLSRYYDDVKHLNDVEKMQYIDINCWLPGDILLKADKMSMAHSLESRVPFLDKEVFNLAHGIPLNSKIKAHKTKALFRDIAEKYLPEEVAEKKKLGFPVPIRVWLKEDDIYNKVMETFTSETAKEYFNTDYLCKLLVDHKADKFDNSRRIWTVYMFLVWHGVYFEEQEMENAVGF
ncbi:MAG: asparagine synthase (glutamine-hydrolyzing) [bacterium]|nr:asparagine synthase (glutamine-hydrolyzing) [bacterium]